jgi:hypothetical protein
MENEMLNHINSMSSALGGPVPIYADCPIMRKGKPTGKSARCPFFNPEIGVRLTHALNLGQVHVGVHHRDNASRFTDFGLIFAPLELVTLTSQGGPGDAYSGGPYTVRIEFKTSDEGVLSEVRVAGRGGNVSTEMIPDPQIQSDTKKKSMMGQLGGVLRSAVNSSVRHVERAKNGAKNFKELDDEYDDEPECYAHDCVQMLETWLAQEVAWPIEAILRADIDQHKGRGY